MSNVDLSDKATRSLIIEQIRDEKNKEPKRESLKRFEIYRERQDRFIIEKLQEEFSSTTVKDMRKILAINPAPRIINSQASIYNDKPERNFGNVSDREREQLENLYKKAKADAKMKLANRYYKLQNGQVILQIIPNNGKIVFRPLLRHQIDVIPDASNPEVPFAYIKNVFDKFDFLSNTKVDENVARRSNLSTEHTLDRVDQDIADPSDYRAKLDRYAVWTKDLNFIMDGNGEILSEEVINPIGMLPFVDISSDDKDGEFFVRFGSNVTDFAIELGAMLSDLANIHRLQGYAQAVISATEQPQDMLIGPNKILFLQKDPNDPGSDAKFEFISPNPDLQSGLNMIDAQIKLFLTSQGLDSGIVNQQGAGTATSGLDRFLQMIERFEASMEDIEVFRNAEEEIFQIMGAWSNLLQGVTDPEMKLDDDLNTAKINSKANMEVEFATPEMMQSQQEKEASIEKRMQIGLISRVEAIMESRGVDREMAEEILLQIDEDKQKLMELSIPQLVQQPVEEPEEESEEEEEDASSEGE